MINVSGRRRRADAAIYLQQRWGMQVGGATLANYAVRAIGPLYCLVGKYAFYADHDLDSWAQSRITAPRRKASGELIDEVTPSDGDAATDIDRLRLQRDPADDAGQAA
jgi:hypothetical protein